MEKVNHNELSKKDKRYHENFFQRAINSLTIFLLKGLSLLPFRIIYALSDILCFLVRRILRYRKKVILDNLHHAFPEKQDKELKEIARKFYCHFTDLTLETIKLHSASEKQMDKHITFEGLETIEDYYRKGKSIIILAMHHNNWEWCSFVQTKAKHQGLLVYNPIRGNQAMEKFLLHSREKWGGQCVPVHHSARTAMEFHRNNIPSALWLGADQTPPKTSRFWTVFLNREAPFFSGPEKIAAKTNQPVFFQHVSKIKRGQYLARFIPLITNPAEIAPREILLAYVRQMEKIIREEPEYYLWSHRRWKHRRPEGIPLTQ